MSKLIAKAFCPLLCLLAVISSICAEETATLKVGDLAPPLFVSKWLNGDPIEKLEQGKCYVVEFWATWCGPCKMSIPHLSKMNTEFKDKITFIGVDCREPDTAKVEPFVKSMGEKMNYRVAIDQPKGLDPAEGKMAAAWLDAAGQDGIPTAFCIDKDGRIGWIGHPMEMQRIVAAMAAGTFDAKKEAELAAKIEQVRDQFVAAAKENDVKKMEASAVQMMDINPDLGVKLHASVFGFILVEKKDYDGAYAYANKVSTILEKDPETLNEVSWTILDAEGIEKRDFDLALKLVQRADELTKHDNAAVIDTLARAWFEKKDTAKAIELEKLAIEKSKDDPNLQQQLTESLKKYEAAKK